MNKIDMLPPPPRAPSGDLSVRELTPQEVATLSPVFKQAGADMPDPAVSTFVGAVKDGAVLGFLVLQLKLHCEPMYVTEGHSDLFLPIVKAAERLILQRTGVQYAYLFAPAGRVSRLAQTMGFSVEPWVVMSKLIAPDMPSKPVVELAVPVNGASEVHDQPNEGRDQPFEYDPTEVQ